MGNSSSSSAATDLAGGNKSTIIADADVVTGSHVLTVQGYSKTLGCGAGKSINSGTFTVGGHSWYIAYYPDGSESVTYDPVISIFVYHDKPETKDDDTVKAWIKITLLKKNGKPTSLSSEKSQVMTFSSAAGHGRVRGWGCHFPKARYEFSSRVKRHDSFEFKCTVTVIKEKPLQTITSSSPLPVPPPDLHRHLARLLETQVGADVEFDVGGELFTAHKAVLANRSPVFMAELFGHMKEKATSKVRIDDMDPNAFRAMLYFIYTDLLPRIEDGDMAVMSQHLLVAADKYDLERLKLICMNKLCSYIDSKTVAAALSLAGQHGCECLKEACVKFLVNRGNLKSLMASDDFEHLMSICPSLLKDLLAKVAP